MLRIRMGLSIAVVVALLLMSCSANDDLDGGLDPNVAPVPYDGEGLDTATTWQWQLKDAVNASYDVDVYDIDLFDNQLTFIDTLQRDDRQVICYFSAGSSEDWRPDFDDLPNSALGEPLADWEGERWLDIRLAGVRDVMSARLELAVEKGCDGVEPDNVDGYSNDTGFDLSASDQLGYNRWLGNEAHKRGLLVGLKNDGDQASALVEYFDFSVNEQCHEFDECDALSPFLRSGKPIFNAEYPGSLGDAEALAPDLCPRAKEEDIRTLILPGALDDSFRISCDDR